MKKTLCLTSLLAIVATGAANATTDVTFAGDYSLENGSTANVATDISGATYTYEKTDGSNATATYNEDPNLTYFTYTDKDGAAADLSSGTNLTQSDFTGTSAASGDIATTQEIVSGATADRANYTYVNGNGDTVELGTSAQSFTEHVGLNSTYTNDTIVDVTDGTAGTFNGSLYVWTDPDTNAVYHLSDDGTKLVDALNMEQTPTAGSAQETAFNEMKDAYTADAAAIAAAETSTAAAAAAEAPLFAAADAVFTADTAKIAQLDTYYATYQDALGKLDEANEAKATATATNAVNVAAQTAARDLYNAPIETTLASVEQNANAYTDAETTRAQGEEAAIRSEFAAADTTLQNNIDAETTRAQGEEAAIRSEFAAADALTLSNANAYTDAETTRAQGEEAAIRSEFAAADALTLSNANAYTDAETTRAQGVEQDLQTSINDEANTRAAADTAEMNARIAKDTTLQNNIDNEVARATAQEAAIRADFAAADALTLSSANAYTDKKVDTLEKNVSGGVAAATALSAVSVSNVKKGEMSVGGGYGYYNNQSAMAFGAAMGLSDNWSINAGAGIASGDKTQVSFRAGTNYKFKLF